MNEEQSLKFFAELEKLGVGEVKARIATQVYLGPGLG